MKTRIFFLLLLGFTTIQAQDHIKKSHSIPVDGPKKIIIALEDDIILTSWDLNRIDINVDIQIKGIHWALGGGKDELRRYDIIWTEEKDTLYIQPKKTKTTATIGVTWLSSSHIHHLHLPGNSDITIRSSKSDVEVQGRFAKLDIINMHGNTDLDLKKKDLRFLECECTDLDKYVRVNGKKVKRKHLYLGEGSDWVSALTMDGEIRLTVKD